MISLLKKWWKRFRYVVHIAGDPYLVRYRLIKTQRRCFYLHHILRSDTDRELHDHPFDWCSIVLWGGYWEILPATELAHPPRYFRCWRGPFSVRCMTAEQLHRLELPEGRTAWTLFIRWPRVREWGFLLEDPLHPQGPKVWLDWRLFHYIKGYNSHGTVKAD